METYYHQSKKKQPRTKANLVRDKLFLFCIGSKLEPNFLRQ